MKWLTYLTKTPKLYSEKMTIKVILTSFEGKSKSVFLRGIFRRAQHPAWFSEQKCALPIFLWSKLHPARFCTCMCNKCIAHFAGKVQTALYYFLLYLGTLSWTFYYPFYRSALDESFRSWGSRMVRLIICILYTYFFM